ncbi:hypothetical protein MGG_09276 [Pyricularia oryzae 70-15]|uniref:Zn(2)-C6 fungal-type domain-containing protein n=3 Tax=Pyricularia oryzae TaxID=318829 RepID=G4MQB2_PYRO7|nr:uncharacterized protein MGG_09276 [Pyricularia oryzae 70-15]EHA57305.1 hypothetical protein MGG_09276 [Pyricularia oryzae 70-15]ELQ40580.1 hypothetical protein OOU_Y34scaffold00414g11 [Pyricularia oryzae Y34]KAI7923180.1 hypothetical protein M9X92_004456 [Pyricularia oryzae]KAI7924100.1 hypothetical protein M0657_004771 [Pyricularia oryzae]
MSLTAAALLHSSCDDASLRSRSLSPASVATATTSSVRDGGSMPPSSSHIQQQQQQQQQHQIWHSIQPTCSKSNGETAGFGSSAGVDTDHEAEAKKPRACDRCRGLKVRCIMEGDGDEAGGGNCLRCTKAGRRCVVTQPTKKRQKKTDSRVAELEKRIDALTASLHDSRRGSGAGEGDGGGVEDASSPEKGDDHDEPPAVTASATSTEAVATPATLGWQRRPILTGGIPNLNTDSSSHMNACGIVFELAAGPGGGHSGAGGQKRKFGDEDGIGSLPPQPPRQTMGPGYEDVVTRSIVTEDMAAQLFARYTDHMCPHLPGVIFPPDMTWNRIRVDKPLLFLAVMAASSSETPSLQRVLVREMMQIFAEKIVIIGEKSIELVQALHIAVFWYWPPEHFEELKFYQLVHMAAVLAIDLGLGRRRPTVRGRHIPWSLREGSGVGPPGPGIVGGGGGGGGSSNDDAPGTKRNSAKRHPPPDPCSLESRRTWLTCYYLASNTSMTLHRPNLVRWTPFMAECLEVLQTSPDAAPTDAYFCHLVWTHKLSEEIGVEFAMDDPGAVVDITDRRTQHAIKSFERQHEKYRDAVPKDLMRPSLKLGFHVVSLYMHEIALRIEEDAGGGCVGEDAALTPAHVSSLSACLAAVDGIFDTFSSMTPEDVRCLPVFNFVRVAYATVLLIKMYFAASAPGSELGKVIDKEEIRVEEHLGRLLDKFRMAAAGNRSRPAAKFHIVIAMLRSWFQKQAGDSDAGDAQEAPTSTQRPQEQGRGAEGGNSKRPSHAIYSADMPFQTPSEITKVDEVETNAGAAAGQPGVTMAGREPTPAGVPWYVSQDTTPQSIMYEASGSDDPVPPLTHTSPSESSPVPVHIRQRQYQQIPPASFPQHQWMDMEFEPATFGDGVVQAMDPGYSGGGSGSRGGFVLPGMMAAAASQNGGGGMMFSMPPVSGTGGVTGESPFAASESWYGGILDSAGMGNMYYL